MKRKTQAEYSKLYEKAILLHTSLKSGVEIARELGISPRVVQDWLKNGKKFTRVESRLDEAKELLDSGVSYKMASEQLGVSSKSLRENLPGMGWSSRQAAQYGNGVHVKMPVNKDSPAAFDKALMIASSDPDSPQPNCITPVAEVSPWIDWATEVENREDYESAAPTEREAKVLCDGCPLESICTAAALARPPYHGVRGSGLRFELGKRIRN